MFFKKSKRIQELERENSKLSSSLRISNMHVLELEKSLKEAEKQVVVLQENFEMEFEDIDDEEEIETEYCSCGGMMSPMYDEHPNWIKYCLDCNHTEENSIVSPIVES